MKKSKKVFNLLSRSEIKSTARWICTLEPKEKNYIEDSLIKIRDGLKQINELWSSHAV